MIKNASRYLPIAFSSEMVDAILAGRKSVTRRVVKGECRYRVGDMLWVREAWQRSDNGFIYKAGSQLTDVKWKSPRFMPRAAARIYLHVTDIRKERLHDITAEEIKAEGVACSIGHFPVLFELWRDLWVGINGQDSWDANPEVWVIAFRKIE